MYSTLSVSRRVLLAGAAGVALPSMSLAQNAIEYLVLTMATENHPLTSIANCAELESSVKYFDAEIKRVKDKQDVVAAEVMKKVQAKKAVLNKAISDAKTALTNAKLDESFVYVNTGLSVAFGCLAIALTGPLSVGVLAGAGVLTGASSFTLQAYYRKGNDQLDFVMGYMKGRSLMFGELAAKAIPVVANSFTAAGYFVAAYEFSNSLNDQASAKKLLEGATRQLEALEKGLAALGADKVAWAKLYESVAFAASSGITAFIAANKATDCRLLPAVAKGPLIIKP